MKVDFTKIKLCDIEGKEIPDAVFYKTIANILYRQAKTLDLVDLAMQINRGEEVEISGKLLEEVKQIISKPESGIYAYARKAAIVYIDSALEELRD